MIGKTSPSPSFHSDLRAHESLMGFRQLISRRRRRSYSMNPVVPLGKTAVSIAMWPCRTRVKARFSSGFGVPKCCPSDELRVKRFLRLTNPCPCHVSCTIEKLRSRVAEVNFVFFDYGGLGGAGLVVNNRSIRSRRRDSVEGKSLEVLEHPGNCEETAAIMTFQVPTTGISRAGRPPDFQTARHHR